MKRPSPCPEVKIAETAYIDAEGAVSGTTWTIDVEYIGLSCGTIVLEDVADLFRLRDAIGALIDARGLVKPEYDEPVEDEEDEEDGEGEADED